MHTQTTANCSSTNTLPWEGWETCSNAADQVVRSTQPVFETLSWVTSSLCSLARPAMNASISIVKPSSSMVCKIVSLLVLGSASGTSTPSSTPMAPTTISDFPINMYNGHQQDPSMAAFSDGSFVVTWWGAGPGDSFGIFGQRFFANGSAWGSEFRVNTYTTGIQWNPNTAAFLDGSFVVTWDGVGLGDSDGIFGQRFFANGSAWGSEFRANSYTNGDQESPSTVAFSDGSFIVTWHGEGIDDFLGIFGQRFFADGSPWGSEFRANNYTNGEQWNPSTAAFSDGTFVVTWEGEGIDDFLGIFGQRFFTDGSPWGLEFRANNYTSGDRHHPSTAAFSDGSFVVTWDGVGLGDSNGIFGQRFFADSSPWGSEFRANNYTNGEQQQPSTAAFSDGSFVVTWEGEGIDDFLGIFGQRFFADGSPWGSKFRANTYTNGTQWNPSMAAFSDGSFVVTWIGVETPLSGIYKIYGKRFDMFGQPIPWETTPFSPSVFPIQTTTSNLNTLTIPSTQLHSPSPSFRLTRPSSSLAFPSSHLSLSPSPSMRSSDKPSSILSSVKTTPTASLSSQNTETTSIESTFPLIISLVYEESYPIVVNGETIGTFTFSGGSGQINSNNDNTLNIELNSALNLETEVAITLFIVPPEEESLWENISLSYDSESQCYHAEGILITSEEDHAYQLTIEPDDTNCSPHTTGALKLSALPALVNEGLL